MDDLLGLQPPFCVYILAHCWTRYGEDGLPASDAFVVGIGGKQPTTYSLSHSPVIFLEGALPAGRFGDRFTNDMVAEQSVPVPCGPTDSREAWFNTYCHHPLSGGIPILTPVQSLSFRAPTLQDSFYKRHTSDEVALAHANRMDFDHPDAIDMPMFAAVQCISSTRHVNVLTMSTITLKRY